MSHESVPVGCINSVAASERVNWQAKPSLRTPQALPLRDSAGITPDFADIHDTLL